MGSGTRLKSPDVHQPGRPNDRAISLPRSRHTTSLRSSFAGFPISDFSSWFRAFVVRADASGVKTENQN